MIEVDIQLRRKNFSVVINETFSDGITGIYGASGSGKTSLLQAIAGLASPQKGEIRINSNTVFNSEKKVFVPVEQRNIGYVFQEGRLFPHMTVEKNLRYGIKKNRAKGIGFDEVVDMLNLRTLLQSKPAGMSGGERQRTALGRSLLSSPDILLLDEPFSAVDTRLREQILPFLLKIHQKVAIPILVVSHDLPDLLKLSNRLCVISEGRCIGHNEYYELLKMPAMADVFGSGSIVNSISMQVNKVNADSGLTVLTKEKNDTIIRVKCEKSKEPYRMGQKLKIFVNAEDIALSQEKLIGITIQNQLEGRITDVIARGSSNLCIVDVGFRLVVEVTAESLKRMDITIGSKVWCLFKSVAIDVAG